MNYPLFFPILDQYAGPFIIGFFLLLLILEKKYPLREYKTNYFKRLIVNGIVSIPTFLALRLVLIPLQITAAQWAIQNNFGLLNLFSLPPITHGVLAFFLLDYLLYLWHVLSHKVPLLWRLHNVHHTDLDLSATTVIRFHFLEILVSAIFRTLGVLLIGAPPTAILIYEVIFQMSVAFHHSNWKLPKKFDRFLTWFIVSPRMHGIHHSMNREEADSNYANFVTFWDRIHRTLKLNKHQDEIIIGVPAYKSEEELTSGELLKMPFKKQPDYWEESADN